MRANCIFLILSFATYAAPAINEGESGLAIDGYDPVAYFSVGKAVAGKKKYTHRWKGIQWRFASAKNRSLFKKKPARYAPRYGGYCAYAVSIGRLAKIDPNSFIIHKGRLYLNYDEKRLKYWKTNIDKRVVQANANWPGVLKKK